MAIRHSVLAVMPTIMLTPTGCGDEVAPARDAGGPHADGAPAEVADAAPDATPVDASEGADEAAPGSLRILTTGAGADARLIFEWSASRIHTGAGGGADTYTTVRIPAHLAPSGVIEIHPCALDVADGHDAAEDVSVGLQGVGGDVMAVGCDEPGLFDAERGWRLAPRCAPATADRVLARVSPQPPSGACS